MRLQTKLNIISVFILLLDAACHISIGAYVITNILYSLNRNILSGELHNRVNKISETYKVLKDAGLANTVSYVDSAQQEITSDLKNYHYGETGGILIADKDGKLVFGQGQSSSPSSVETSYLAEMIKKQQGSIEFTSDKKGYYAAYETFPEWKWTIALSITTDEMMVRRQQYLKNVSIIALFILLLNTFVLRGFGRRLTARIETSLAALKKVEAGDLSVRIPNITETDEIGILQQGINSMISVIEVRTDEIARARDTLELRVEERTGQLAEKSLQLKEQLRNSSNLLDSMRQVVFAVDQTGTIIAPVSKSAEVVFGEQVEGKSIFDSIFKGLDRRSEAYSALNTGFITVFGEGSLQWDLTCDIFPTEIVYQSKLGQRTLKVSYSPMWGDQEQLEKLMLVIEDITSLIELEKNVAAAKALAAKSMQMMQELSANKVEELDGFFGSAFDLLAEARMKFRMSDVGAYGTCLRNLHTLKGNARVFSLSRISSATHEAEALVQEIGSERVLKTPTSVEVILADVRASVFEYADFARKIYHAKNKFHEMLNIELHETMARVDLALSGLERGFSASTKQAVAQALQEFTLSARSLKDNDLVGPVTEIRLALQGDVKDFSKLVEGWEKLANLVRTRLFAVNHWHPVADEVWVEIIMGTFHSITNSKKGGSAKAFRPLVSLCSSHQLEALASLAVQLSDDSLTPEARKAGVDALWSYVCLVSQVQASFTLKSDSADTVAHALQSTKYILGRVFKNFQAIKITPAAFFELSGTRAEDWFASELDMKEIRAVADGLGGTLPLIQVKGVIQSLSKQANRPAVALNSLFAESQPAVLRLPYLKTTEVLRLLKPCFDDAEAGTFKPIRAIEIAERPYSEFKQMLTEIRTKATVKEPKLQELFELFDRLAYIPLSPVIQKLVPMARDVAARLGKKVDIAIVGDEVTLDRERLSILNDVLVHLVRNALDHGVESPSARMANGKNESGKIEIECKEVDRQLRIRVTDDGKGIDPDLLADSAIEKGHVDRESVKDFTAEQKLDLVFLPGFSTKAETTEISGRGIGMDIVKSNVEALGGSVKIVSKVGQGTQVLIQFSTLADAASGKSVAA